MTVMAECVEPVVMTPQQDELCFQMFIWKFGNSNVELQKLPETHFPLLDFKMFFFMAQ